MGSFQNFVYTATKPEVKSSGVQITPLTTVNQAKLQHYIGQLRAKQRWLPGIAAGVTAAFISTILWVVAAALTHQQLGGLAIVVGLLTSSAIRRYGRGIDRTFGVAGAVLVLLACLLGYLWSGIDSGSHGQPVNYLTAWSALDPKMAFRAIAAALGPLNLLCFGMAVFAGYRFSFRRLNKDEIHAHAG